MARTPPARTAGQRPLIALVAVIVLGLAGSALAAELAARQEPTAAAPDAGPAAPSGPSPEPGREAVVVGPARGADVATYVEDRTGALLGAPPTVDTAVVSFTEALTVAEALTVVGDGLDVRAVLLRLPLDLATPQTVRIGPSDDVAAAVAAALDERLEPLTAEEASTRQLLESGTVDDQAFVEEYERRLDELVAARQAAEEGEVVHAVVVRGALADLQAVVDAPAVRLVDPAPPGADAASSVFHGLLPGDTDTVRFGRAP